MWGGAGVLILALLFIAFAMFQKTSVVVTPRTHPISADNISLTAYPASTPANAGELTYIIASQTFDATKSVPANGTMQAQDYASGQITVYNESAGQMRLIKNTRFETPAALIFRIHDSVNVPAAKAGVPGSATVTAYADQPGDQYNIAPTERFTVPGLSGGPNFKKVYAKSTAAFIGGFVGMKPSVAVSDLDAARTALRTALEQQARASANTLTATGTAVFPDLLSISYESLPVEAGQNGTATVHEKATVTLPVFPTALFAKKLAVAVSADSGDAPMHLMDAGGLTVHRAESSGTAANAPITITVTGKAALVWDVDAAALAKALAGTSKAKSSFDSMISGFPGVDKADAFIRPFWRGTFPSDPSQISIVVTQPR